ncbi:MAG: transporter substrate-binding domain-containing protein [Nitrospirae bacterium]|nr:transporter substrate-binding domain-containing protein [Nitrospirota bacterium]
MKYKPLPIASALLFGILTLLYYSGSVYAQQGAGEFLAGVPRNFPPHYSIDNKTGEPAGFAIDIMDEVARRSGIRVRYVVYPTWAKTFEAMEKGKVVLIPNLGITAEREAYMDFTSPVETAPIVIFVRATTTDIKSVDDLDGKEVAVVEQNKGLFLMQERGGSKLLIYASQDEAFLSLISGRSDALVFPEPPIAYLSRKSGLDGRIKIVGKPLLEVKRSIAVRAGNHELQKKLDDEVKTFIKTPRYADIYAKWYGKPAPYWTARRVAVFGGGFLALVIVTLVVWRYLSMLRLNRDLKVAFEELKKAEEALQEREERLRSVIEQSPIGIALSRDGITLDANKAYLGMFGYSAIKELSGKPLIDQIAPQCRPEILDRISRRARGQAAETAYETIGLRKDGSQFPFYVSVSRINLPDGPVTISFFIDITGRKQTEAALHESEEIFSQFLQHSPIYVFFKDDAGRPVRLSSNFEKMLGKPVPELLGKTMDELFPTDLAKSMIADDLRILKEGKQVEIEEELNGRFYSTIKFPIYRDGKARYLAGFTMDITDRRKLEEQLLQSQKMEAVGQFAGGIAHDFNNILTAIIGYACIAQMKMKTDDPVRVNVDHILESANRAAALTQSLLAFSRKQVMNFRPVDVNEIIQRVEKFLQRIIGEDIEMKTIAKQGALMVNADSGQIEQVLMNLATNARDAMPKGGVLTIETDTVMVDDEYIRMHGVGKQGPYAVVSVSDTGEGMDETTRKRIFDPFFTTKETGKGTGLGLSIVYGIVQQHKGFVNVYSEQENGTNFKIYLPIVQTPAEVHQTLAVSTPVGGIEMVLLAEDDEKIRELSRQVLQDFGYTVITAKNGEEAVLKFREQKDRIRLVILDVVMPRMSGSAAYQEMKKIRPDIKAMFISGYAADDVHIKWLLAAGMSVIQKPVSPTDFLKKVREVLEKK